MKNEGWTWGDLVGELYARGIDPDEVGDHEIQTVLGCHTPEQAAARIAATAGPTMDEYMSLPESTRRYGGKR
jgi:hypothetical protein